MKPQKQRYMHDPANGIFGDCYRTCLAVLLDLDRDDVPHFVNNMEPDAWKESIQPRYDTWLLEHAGLVEIAIPYDCDADGVLALQQVLNPTVYYMLAGRSRTGCNHVVICKGDKIVCDTSLNEAGIVGRCEDGYHWISFLVPASLSAQSLAGAA